MIESTPKYKFYLQSKTGLYYYDTGVGIGTSITKKELKYSPEGWDKIVLSWERDTSLHGVVRKMSTPFSFVNDSAKILKYIHLNKGINGYCKFVIERFNNSLSVQDYEIMYSGEVNFVGANLTKYKFNCEVIEGGFLSKLESRFDTNYEIDLFHNPEQIWVKMDGINLQYTANWVDEDNQNVPISFFKHHIPRFIFYYDEGTNLYASIYDQSFNVGIPAPLQLIENKTNHAIIFDLIINYYYNIYTPNNDIYFQIGYEVYDLATSGNISHNVIYQEPTQITSGNSGTKLGTQIATITLNPGEGILHELNCVKVSNGSLVNDCIITQLGSSLELNMKSRTKTTYIKALRTPYVFEYLASKINDDEALNFTEDILNDNYEFVLTSFDSLRNLENCVLKTNMADFYKSMNAILNIGLDYNANTNTFSIDNKTVHYNSLDTPIIDLGQITDFELTPITNDMFSKLNVGYNKYDYDEVNGKDEHNTDNEFLSPLDRVKNAKDMKSPYRADMYGIEVARINLTNKKVTDNENDNDIAILHIGSTVAGTIPTGEFGEGEDYYELYRKPINTTPGTSYFEIENIYSPETAYNIELSPKRNLYRNWSYIRSLLYGNDDLYLKYQTSSKSNFRGTKMVTKEGSPIVTINEGSDVLIGTIAEPLFKPFMIKCRTKNVINIESLMTTSNYKYRRIKGEDAGKVFYGFILSIKNSPTYGESQEWQLICSPDTDLSQWY